MGAPGGRAGAPPADRRANDPGAIGTLLALPLTIAVRPDACRTAPLPDGPVLFTTWLKTAETGGYVALARDVDLRTIDGGQDIAARIPAC